MFGNKLKSLRENYGLTQEQLARRFNLMKSSISMYENNVRFPNVELVKEFANFFNVSIDYLLDNENKYNIDNEFIEKELLKELLIKNGYLKQGEDLTKEELDKLMKFISANKEFIKENK